MHCKIKIHVRNTWLYFLSPWGPRVLLGRSGLERSGKSSHRAWNGYFLFRRYSHTIQSVTSGAGAQTGHIWRFYEEVSRNNLGAVVFGLLPLRLYGVWPCAERFRSVFLMRFCLEKSLTKSLILVITEYDSRLLGMRNEKLPWD